jgi:hypothetical protein
MDTGLTLIAVWFVATGLISLVNLKIPRREQLMGALALIAGILVLLRR